MTWESPGTIPITATHIDGWYQEIATALRPRNDTVFEHIRRGGLKIRPIVIPSEAEESTHLKGQKIPRLHFIPLGMTRVSVHLGDCHIFVLTIFHCTDIIIPTKYRQFVTILSLNKTRERGWARCALLLSYEQKNQKFDPRCAAGCAVCGLDLSAEFSFARLRNLGNPISRLGGAMRTGFLHAGGHPGSDHRLPAV